MCLYICVGILWITIKLFYFLIWIMQQWSFVELFVCFRIIDSISSVSVLPSCPRTAVTPRTDVNSDELIHWRLTAHITSSKSRNGNSGRWLRFLSDSEQPNGHRNPAQCECRLAISAIQNCNERTSWLVGFVPVCPEWGAAVLSGRQAGRHASLPRYYQDTYR